MVSKSLKTDSLIKKNLVYFFLSNFFRRRTKMFSSSSSSSRLSDVHCGVGVADPSAPVPSALVVVVVVEHFCSISSKKLGGKSSKKKDFFLPNDSGRVEAHRKPTDSEDAQQHLEPLCVASLRVGAPWQHGKAHPLRDSHVHDPQGVAPAGTHGHNDDPGAKPPAPPDHACTPQGWRPPCVSRRLAGVRRLLLLRAGDVEENPGMSDDEWGGGYGSQGDDGGFDAGGYPQSESDSGSDDDGLLDWTGPDFVPSGAVLRRASPEIFAPLLARYCAFGQPAGRACAAVRRHIESAAAQFSRKLADAVQDEGGWGRAVKPP